MPKAFTKESVIQNKKEAIKSINKLLEQYINDPSEKHLKKANILSYWLKDFSKYIQNEEHFDPTKNISYKRGNIVKLNFGFNVGSEYGGLHYGVVLDKNNEHNSPVLTVIPLTSIKENKTVHPNSLNLGNDIYRMLKIKYDTISKALKEEQAEIEEELSLFRTLVGMANITVKELEECDQDSKEFNEKIIASSQYSTAAYKLQKAWEEKERHNKE